MSSDNEISKHCCDVSGSAGEAPLCDNLLKMSNTSTSVLFESNSPYFIANKAVFTIHLSNSQILVVNSVACQLVHYNSDELCSMKLETLIHDSYKQKWTNLKRHFCQNSPNILCSKEKLIEFITKNDDTIVASLYLKRLDSLQKCLVIAELIDRRQGVISIDNQGKILSHDEEVAFLFQYDASKLVGINVKTLLPALQLRKHSDPLVKLTYKQYTTGRTRNRDPFPVCLTINCGNSNSEIIQIIVWVYPSVSGLLLLNEKLLLKNYTHYFVKLLFGFSKKKFTNQPVTNFIPSFSIDLRIDRDRSIDSHLSNEVLSNESDKSDADADLTDNVKSVNLFADIKSDSKSSSLSSNLNFEYAEDQSNADVATFKTLFSHNSRHNRVPVVEQKHQIFNSLECQNDKNDDENDGDEYYQCIADKKGDLNLNTFSEYFAASGDKFTGYGKHADGTYIDIKYQMKRVTMSDEVYYCVWVFSDWAGFLNLKNGSNISRSSSLNSTSIDSFFTKDSTYSESWAKTGNVSMISQCDEVLTAGEYSQHYTNVMEIGKGAFGYVKMAFRNSDGLLVVTKFIKKQKVNISSWVQQPDLNMKIPLEISLLITLEHPNIVRVLDVFHNDCFVQLVMEKHGAGFDLFEFIDRGPKYDEKLKSYIFRQIVSAVHYLDSLGILHRDIKDENVIINEKFEIKLIDFGSAAFMPPDESFSKFYGTVEYCSPEVLQGNSYRGPELEIWALGVTLYILTFGENPFYDVEDTVKGRFSIPSPISQELHDLLCKMLDTNVKTRITIDKVAANEWVNQPVAVENYKFEEVVRCHESEAHPPKYIYEISSQDYFSKPDLRIDVAESSETHFSESSIHSKDLDHVNDSQDKICDLYKLIKFDSGPQRRDTSPVLVSSTPMKKRNFRLCKSAVGVRKRSDNFSPLNEFSTASCDANWFEKKSNLNSNKLKQLNKSSPNLMGTQNPLRKDTLIAWDNPDRELQVRFEKCVFAEAGKTSAKESPKSLSNNSTVGEESGRGEKDGGYLSF